VPNRYFGVFQDGSVKARGIDLRRRDSAPFVADTQREMLRCLSRAKEPDALQASVGAAVEILRCRLKELHTGAVPLEDLLVGKRLSKELGGYRVPSPGARAAKQLAAAGKTPRPGQRVRLLFIRGKEGVCAWDLPGPPDPQALDLEYYERLLLRAAANLLQPFGLDECTLRVWTCGNSGEQLSLPLRAWCRQREPYRMPLQPLQNVLKDCS